MDSSLVYLAQTDTTVGFLSQDDKKLSQIKQRDQNKKTLQVVNCFFTLQKQLRVPKKFRKIVRNSIKTTYIYPNQKAFRVVSKDSIHKNFLDKFQTLYSTSANKTQNSFDEQFAINNADVVVYSEPFEELAPSSIYKLYKSKKRKIR